MFFLFFIATISILDHQYHTTDKINYSIIDCSRSLCIRIKQIKIRSKIKKNIYS